MPALGKNTSLSLDNAAGTPVDISTKCNTSSASITRATSEVTVYGDGAQKFIAGLRNNTFSMGGLWDATINTHLFGLNMSDATATLVFGPHGDTAGLPSFTMEVLVTSFTIDPPNAEAVTWSAEFQVDGEVTLGVYS
jgi:hypothetical protein